MFYKITHELIDISPSAFLTPGDAKTRGGNKYCQLPSNRDAYKFSFFPRTIVDWNNLPEVMTQTTVFEDFRMQLRKIPAALNVVTQCVDCYVFNCLLL